MLYQNSGLLTQYHTIPTLTTPPTEKAFENIVEKGENAGNQHFLLSPKMFSTFLKTNSNFSATFDLSYTNAFSLDQSTILSFGKEFKQWIA